MADNNNIIIKTMEDVMHESMMPYSEHVILDRALPRVEDGLKPVQRRILYTMYTLGITPDSQHRKSARVVGDCLGKFHPHGDRSIYDAMVRMAQGFNMRHTIVDGHGNFGSIDGDSAAAMRYTEVRMAPLALELLRDIEKDTVRWNLNFDDTTKEPEMLPGRYPNLLVNGASGIAVGLATNIPPHNLAEVIDGVIAFIDNPNMTLAQMMKIVKGPDFPTGGYLITGQELIRAYETGKGKVTMRAKVHIEIAENDKRNIVIDELPFQVNKAALLESIVALREEKKELLGGISEILDESDRSGMRAIIRVKKDHDPREIVEQLFKHTNLQQTFGINIVAIADGKPQQMGLLDIIAYYVAYQREVIVRRTKFDYDEAKIREEILSGLLIAIKNIDEVIKIIKGSPSVADARQRLRDRFALTERQATEILNMRLSRLTHLEINKLEKELEEVRQLIVELSAILGSKKKQMEVVKGELLQVKKSYRDARRTVIIENLTDYCIESEDDVKNIQQYVIGVTASNCLKKIPAKNFSMTTKAFSEKTNEHEICPKLISAETQNMLLFFTNRGNCYKVREAEIPEIKWREKGTPLHDIIKDAEKDEKIVEMFAYKGDFPTGELLFYTREGMVKRTLWQEYNVSKYAFQAIKLKESDELIGIEQFIPETTLFFVTAQGMCLNAEKEDIPVQGRIAGGVKGIMLEGSDYVAGVSQITDEGEFVLVTDKAYAKRVIVCSVDVMARYRKGVKIFDFRGDNGEKLVFASYVKDPYTVVLSQDEGYLVAFDTESIQIEARTGKGKPLIKLRGESVIKACYQYSTTVSK